MGISEFLAWALENHAVLLTSFLDIARYIQCMKMVCLSCSLVEKQIHLPISMYKFCVLVDV